ncbi:hypothetical protein FDECE_17111 [Fusarium decemcellulare]|nr:hypothetical protein FDECE_17111 [Fusarium decemcellulare]
MDALVARDKHEILVLSRQIPSDIEDRPGVTWEKADYNDKKSLKELLSGVEAVLSFVLAKHDSGNVAQKNLIDAAIEAGVKRFAPSEYVSASFENLPFYQGKAEIRDYLQELNAGKKVLEYSLFQPGLFLNYLASPKQTAKHLTTFPFQIDFEHCRAIVVDGDDPEVTLTTVQDLAGVIARAVEYEGEWPINGGISANQVRISNLLKLGQKIRGKPFVVEKVNAEDLENGDLKATWVPNFRHSSFSEEEAPAVSKMLTISFLLSFSKRQWVVSDDWNRLLPDYEFTKIENFLSSHWHAQD